MTNQPLPANSAMPTGAIVRGFADSRAYHHGSLRDALIVAARALVTETQDWTFSIREVARRAGVSHNAPYNHFEGKRDMLAAVAADGFETLRQRTLRAISAARSAREALSIGAHEYVQSGIENPALYRLMFSSALVCENRLPNEAHEAGQRTRSVLGEIVLRGAKTGEFALNADNPDELASVVLSLWSTVHGLTIFVIDGMTRVNRPIPELIDHLVEMQFKGLVPRA